MKYNFAVVVGRFQPFHNTHLKLINYALSLGQTVLVILGSAKSAPNVKNPFTPEMREKMIRSCFSKEMQSRLKFYGVRDYPCNELHWIANVQNIVMNELEDAIGVEEGHDALHSIELGKQKTALVGHFKDDTSYYLKLFPQWTFESFYDHTNESKVINATDIRTLYFRDAPAWDKLVPPSVASFLKEFQLTEEYANLVDDFAYIEQYQKDTSFVGVPFAPTFVTTDAVVEAMGHVLVVRRGANPGKGRLALPGGFLEPSLTLRQNAIKELKEESRIIIDSVILDKSIVGEKVFDYPYRSLRGRTITYAFHFKLAPKMNEGLPLVKGGDDAKKAFWLPVASLGDYEEQFFEDHLDIIRYFLGVV